MKKIFLLLLSCFILFLAACGGSAEPEPTAVPEPVQEETAVEPEEDSEELEEEAMDEEEMEEEAMDEEEMEEPTAEPEEIVEEEAMDEEEMEEPTAEPEEEAMEENAASGFGDLAMSGTDPDTGLEINPDTYGPGDTFIARGTIISMNLTPVTSPEFLIEAPNGVRYRVKTQALDDTYFVDGSQWQPFEFRQGVGATVTIMFDSGAALSDIPTGEDLVLIMQE